MNSQSVSVILTQPNGSRISKPFSSQRLTDSIHAACLSVNLPDGLAVDTAKHTTKAVELWLSGKTEVTTEDVRRIATHALTVVSPEAAYLYKHEKTIL